MRPCRRAASPRTARSTATCSSPRRRSSMTGTPRFDLLDTVDPGGGPYARGAGGAGTEATLPWHHEFLNGSLADRLAERHGCTGSPITLTTACASGASAIQLGVESIRRGERPAALCIGTDGSINSESLIRFALLSALSTKNDPPEQAAKPFSRNRDGFVMAEGAAALVLEHPEHARARGAPILGYILGCGEAADTFHRTPLEPGRRGDHPLHGRSHRRRRAGAGGHRLYQCARDRNAGERQDGISRHLRGVRRRQGPAGGQLQQVDDRPHAHRPPARSRPWRR